MSNSGLECFIPAHPRHFHLLPRVVEAIRQFVQPTPRHITVVSPAMDTSLHNYLVRSGVLCVDEREVMNVSGDEMIAGNAIPADVRRKVYAQLLKWELRKLSTSDSFLVIDADTVFTRAVHFARNDKAVLYRTNSYHFPFARGYNWHFGLIPPPRLSFVPEFALFDRRVIDQMVRTIEGRYRNVDWRVATLDILNGVERTDFSATETFGTFLELNYPNSFESSEIDPADAAEIARTPRAVATGKVVRMSTLGHNGRFGNQFFQYAFTRILAEKHGLSPETPAWVGCGLFGHPAHKCEGALPVVCEEKSVVEESGLANAATIAASVDIWGYFQFHTRFYQPHREFIQRLFQPLPNILAALEGAVGRVRANGRPLVALHIRRGDFGNHPLFWCAPEQWYIQWLSGLLPTLNNPAVYIATDDPKNVLPHFAQFSPVTASDLGVTLKGAEFYTDFHVLSQADHLAISNSTFSFAAAMMNRRCCNFARPEPQQEAIVSFDPWNSDVLLTHQQQAAETSQGISGGATRDIAFLKQARDQIAGAWLQVSRGQIKELFAGEMGSAMKMLRDGGVHRLDLTEVEIQVKSRLLEQLQRGPGGAIYLQCLLAATLYCKPGELPLPASRAHIPGWICREFSEYFDAPASQAA